MEEIEEYDDVWIALDSGFSIMSYDKAEKVHAKAHGFRVMHALH